MGRTIKQFRTAEVYGRSQFEDGSNGREARRAPETNHRTYKTKVKYMKFVNRIVIFSLILTMTGLFSACGETKMEGAFAKGVVALRTARRVSTIQYNSGQITADQYRSRLLLFRDLNVAVDETADQIIALGTITSTNKDQVLVKLNDLFAKIDKLIAEGHVGIRNVQSINDYRNNLLIARTVLTGLFATIETLKNSTPVAELEVKS